MIRLYDKAGSLIAPHWKNAIWGSAKEQWDTQDVVVKQNVTLEVVHWNQKLCDSRIG